MALPSGVGWGLQGEFRQGIGVKPKGGLFQGPPFLAGRNQEKKGGQRMKTVARIVLSAGFIMGLALAGAEGPWWGNLLGLALFLGSVWALSKMEA